MRWNERRQGVKVWKHLGRGSPGSSNNREHGLTLTQVERLLFLNSSVRYYKVFLSLLESLLRLHLNVYFSHMRLPRQTCWGLVLFGPVDGIKLME